MRDYVDKFEGLVLQRVWLSALVSSLFTAFCSVGLWVFLNPDQPTPAEEVRNMAYSIGAWFVTTVTAYLLLLSAKSGRDERHVRQLLGQVSAMTERTQSFQKYANETKAKAEILARLADARDVRNTFVGIADLAIGREHEVWASKAYAQWLDNPHDGTWTDLVGLREYYSGRYSQLPVASSVGKALRLLILKRSIPFINFCIFSYPDGRPDEVFLGWLPVGQSRQASILSTSDPFFVNMCKSLFDGWRLWTYNADLSLDREAVCGFEVQLHAAAGAGRFVNVRKHLVDKCGVWLTRAQVEGGTDDDVTFALVKISQGVGPLDLDVRIWRANGGSRDGPASLRVLENAARQLVVQYSHHSGQKGLCTYEFGAREPHDFVKGYFTGQRGGKMCSLAGFRLPRDIAGTAWDKWDLEQVKAYETELIQLHQNLMRTF